MKNSAKVDGRVIDYDKLNALNMQSKDLGDAYLYMKWDPLGPDFKLDLPYIEKYLRNARDKSEIKTPDFINKSNREVKKAFKNALENNIAMRTEIQNKYDLGEYALYNNTNIEEQVKDILFFLKCREQMLQIVIGKIKVNGINTLQAYKNIYSLNKKLSALLEESYRQEYNKKIAIDNMLRLAQQEKEREQQNQPQKEEEQAYQTATIAQNISTVAKSALNIIDALAKGITNVLEDIFSM